jgi:hypothetical protein
MRTLFFAALLVTGVVAQTPAFDVVSVKPLGLKNHIGPQLGCTGERFESAPTLTEVLIWFKDRYKTIAHREPRETPVYVLMVARTDREPDGHRGGDIERLPGSFRLVDGPPGGFSSGRC